MDAFADPNDRDTVSPFLDLLWRRQRAHEQDALKGKEVVDLSNVSSIADRTSATLQAVCSDAPLIYGGILCAGDLSAEPDVLRFDGTGYVPGDIKAGAGEEGDGEDAKPKKRYAVPLALSVDVLERIGRSNNKRNAFVWDVNDDEIVYDLVAAKGKRTPESFWDDYQSALSDVREIYAGVRNPGPGYQGECKHCVWYSSCQKRLREMDDLTLLPQLGRSKRDVLIEHVNNVEKFANSDPSKLIDEKGKSLVKGIGPESLVRFHDRAVLKHTNGTPYLRSPLSLPTSDVELFFDIETDPGRNLCYLHGFVERRGSEERYLGFFTTDPTAEAEREAFKDAIEYVRSHDSFVMYIYSKYERTWWRALQERYPDVCSREYIDEIFSEARTVDLLQVVQSQTEWPTQDHTIKTLARYLGFSWRDAHPSGAASIEWFDRYIGGDASAKPQILEYNEDDCRAALVLLDGIRQLRTRD